MFSMYIHIYLIQIQPIQQNNLVTISSLSASSQHKGSSLTKLDIKLGGDLYSMVTLSQVYTLCKSIHSLDRHSKCIRQIESQFNEGHIYPCHKDREEACRISEQEDRDKQSTKIKVNCLYWWHNLSDLLP